MKKVNESVDDLTKKEISLVETNDKLAKLEKEKQRKDKLIAEYKEREKLSARALVLYERKIKWLKESIIDDILKICKDIETNKAEFLEHSNKILSQELKDDFYSFTANFALTQDSLYDICNKLEANATITQSDRDFISNKAETKKQPEKLDADARFDMLKKQFDQKIGASVLRKPGRPKKSDQSIVSEIGLGKNPENKLKENDNVQEKLNNLFYETPENKQVVSNIPKTQDSMFDFNEALNPNISLKSIMADIMDDSKDNEVKNHFGREEKTQEIKSAQKKSKIELLEAGIFCKPYFEENKPKSEMAQIDEDESDFSDKNHVVNYSGKIRNSRLSDCFVERGDGQGAFYDNKRGINQLFEDNEPQYMSFGEDNGTNYMNESFGDDVNYSNANDIDIFETDLYSQNTKSNMFSEREEVTDSKKTKNTFEQKFMSFKDLISEWDKKNN